MARYEQYHVFAIPPHLLDNLVPRNLGNLQSAVPDEPSRPASPSPPSAAAPATTASRACNICLGATFADVNDQRTHFRSDWHRYNVKMRMGGGNAVTETQFAQLVDGMCCNPYLALLPYCLVRLGGLPLRFSIVFQ